MKLLKNLFLISFILLSKNLLSQHTIKLHSGDTLHVQIIEITEKKTTYKMLDYFNGPSIVLSNSKIEQITYPNGEMISFEDASPLGKEVYIVQKNSIEILLSEISLGRFGLGYNRNFGQNFNLRMTGVFTLSQNKIFSPNQEINHYVSLEGQFFPLGHKKVSFFTGLRTLFGQYQYFNYSQNNYSYFPINETRNFGSVQILNGLQINISQSFNINTFWSTGLFFTQVENNNYPINQLTISIGFKF